MKRRSTFSQGRRSLSAFDLGSDNATQRPDDTALREIVIVCASDAYGEIVQDVNVEKAETAKMEVRNHFQLLFERWKLFTLEPSPVPDPNKNELFNSMKDMNENMDKFHRESLKWDEILSTMRDSCKETEETNFQIKSADETPIGFPTQHIVDDHFSKAFKDIILKLHFQEKKMLKITVDIDKLYRYARSAIIPLNEHAPSTPRTLIRALIEANSDQTVTDEVTEETV